MAAKRQERLLERQRGAGTRQIKNAAFNLLLPGQEDAINLPLLPQKSGRSRKTPQPELLPQKSGRSRKTQQPELHIQRSTRKTPAPEEVLIPRSTRKTPSRKQHPSQAPTKEVQPPGITRKRGRPRALPAPAVETISENFQEDGGTGTGRKRRKLNQTRKVKAKETGQNVEDEPKPDQPEVQVKNSQPENLEPKDVPVGSPKKKRRKRKSIGQQSIRKSRPQGASPLKAVMQPKKRGPKPKQKPPQPIEPIVRSTPEPPEYSRITTPALPEKGESNVPASPETVENGLDPAIDEIPESSGYIDDRQAPQVAQRKEEAKPRAGKRSANVTPRKRGQSKVVANAPVPDQHTWEIVAPGDLDRGQVAQGPQASIANPALGANVTQPSKPVKPKRRRRKPIGQQSIRAKRTSTDSTNLTKSRAKETSTVTKTKKLRSSKANTSAANGSNAKKDLKPINENNPQAGTEKAPKEMDNTAAALPQVPKKRGRPRKIDEDKQLEPASTSQAPKPQKQPSSSKAAKPTRTTAPKSRKSPPPTIPITVYVPTSPTSTSSDDSDAMNDPLSNPSPRPTDPPINAVDVLAQSVSETITKISQNLASEASSSTDPTEISKLQRKKSTVDMYGEELHERLLLLTTTLNQNIELNRRVRKAVEEQRGLKKQIVALKREREKVREGKGSGEDEMVEDDMRGDEMNEDGTTEDEAMIEESRESREEDEMMEETPKDREPEKEETKLEKLLAGIKGAVKKGWAMEAREKELGKEGQEDVVMEV